MDYRSRQDKSPKKEVGCSKGVQDGGSERKNVSLVWGGTNELSKQAMLEERKRQKKHFQMVLESWESLLEKEKDEKLSVLKEKVEIQRQLIRKIDEQREMKNHLMKQEKDKKKKQPQVNNKPSLIASHPARRNQTRLPTNKIMTPDIVEQMVEASDVGEEDTNTSNQNDTQPLATESPQQLQESNKEKVNHETQERHIQIEDLWMNLKTHSNKKLKTFQSHLDRLKEISSPSVKECLQIYNQSRLNNSSVGQPVSLSMMLKNMKESTLPNDKMHTLTIARASADIKSKCTKQMLQNSQLVQSTNNSDINWFTGLNVQQSSNNKSLEPLKETQFSVDTFTTSVRGPKISFLKEDESITSTENILKSVTIQEPIKKERLSTRWHPLSLNALGEYQSVKETTASGNGPFRNGIATLWKQAEAIHQQ